MRRRLIDFDGFKKIQEESYMSAEQELIEVEDVLACALNTDEVKLHCFSDLDVVYETVDRNFIHASYKIEDNKIFFDNIEELVIDEQSAKKEARNLLVNLVENLLKNEGAKANEFFNKYMDLPTVRKDLLEGEKVDFWVEKPGTKAKKSRGPQAPSIVAKRVRAKKLSQSHLPDSEKRMAKVRRKALKAQFGEKAKVHARFKAEPKAEIKVTKKKMHEWFRLAENVMGFLDYQDFGPTMNNSEAKYDQKGNVVALKVPTATARNEGKVLSLTYKNMLDTEVKVLRGKMKNVHEQAAFCHAVSDLRKANAMSDDTALQQVIEAVIKRWPDLVYLTQTELAESIRFALEAKGETHWDDDVCNFLAEGILRTAVEAYSDKVKRIATLAGVELKDKEKVYETFQENISKFYAHIDETNKTEFQLFVDLYNTLVEIYKQTKDNNSEVFTEANTYLKELHAIINQQVEPDFKLAEEIAEWLALLVETNLDCHDWEVSNDPYHTVSGDHPQMTKNAQKGYTPSADFSGNWGDPAPVSDGKDYKGKDADEMRNNAWGNWSDTETWPALHNPYTPKPFGDYTMKGETGADKGGTDDLSRYQSKDTWPNLENPYQPKAETPQSYKMKSDNLVVEK